MSVPRTGGLRPFQPQRFGRFTLLAPLAAGGMGQIFLARARFAGGLEKLCVIKKVLPGLAQDAGFAARFRDEAQTLVQLQHGSIAQVYDSGHEDGEWWIALEFVDGKDLRRLLQRVRAAGRRVPLPVALYVALKILEALAYAHRKKDDAGNELGLVHRDVSPQNVLLSYEGEVKVIDFGLARSAITAPEAEPSVVMGKFHYMAPEQARNLPLDRRADLYAVGVILYELVTGWNPLEEASSVEVVEWAASPRIPPVQRLAPDLPAAVAAAVTKALAVDPAARFASAEEMRARIAACLSEVAPDVGPEALADLLVAEFAEEYQRERAWMAATLRGEQPADAGPFGAVGTGASAFGRARESGPGLPVEPSSDPFATGASGSAQARLRAAIAARAVPWEGERTGSNGAPRSAAAAEPSATRPLPWNENGPLSAGGAAPAPEDVGGHHEAATEWAEPPARGVGTHGEADGFVTATTGLPEDASRAPADGRGDAGAAAAARYDANDVPAGMQGEFGARRGDPAAARADAERAPAGMRHDLDAHGRGDPAAARADAEGMPAGVGNDLGANLHQAAPARSSAVPPGAGLRGRSEALAGAPARAARPRRTGTVAGALLVLAIGGSGWALLPGAEPQSAAAPQPESAPTPPAPALAPPPVPAPEPAAAVPAVVAPPEPVPTPAPAQEPAPRPSPKREAPASHARPPVAAAERPAEREAPQRTDSRQALLARRRQVIRKYEALVRDHGADQVGGIVAGLVRATDSQFQRMIDDPGHHDDLQRQLDELDRLLEERRRAFVP